MVTLKWGAATHTGLVRSENEDSYVVDEPVFAVADGMGGHLAGEVASQMAVATLRRRADDRSLPDVDSIIDAVRSANLEINDAAASSADQRGMGTTLTALAVVGSDGSEQLALVNVGDSRAYVLRNDRFVQLSVDHSYVQELIASGQLAAAEARFHPHRNIVTRALGIDRSVQIDAWTLTLVTGDRFLLCSDGLVDEVVDETIADLLRSIDDPQQVADQLVATANRHGGRDNTTVVVVDVVAGGSSPDTALGVDLEPHWADGEAEVGRWSDETPTTGEVPGTPTPTEVVAVIDITGAMRRPARADGTAPGAAAGAVGATSATGEPPAAAAATTVTAAEPRTVATAPPTTVIPDTSGLDAEPVARRRRLTVPMIIFVTAVLAVFVVAFTVTAAYARSGYFLGFDGDNVVVFKGQPGGVLWFDPTIEAIVPRTRDEIPANGVDVIERHPTFDSLDAAVAYVDRVAPTSTTIDPATSTTAPTAASAPTTTVTTGAGQGTAGP